MTRWRLAQGLIKLRNQLNQAWPGRSKASDGSIGDSAHAERVSDHNPNAQGVVTAIDVTHDPTHGVDGHLLSETLIKDSRTKYVIFAGRIWKARTGVWEQYFGSNQHNHHVHISISEARSDVDRDWILPGPVELRTVRRGSQGAEVITLQQKLKITVDGTFGPSTEKAVRLFQSDHGLTADGVVGPATWAALKG